MIGDKFKYVYSVLLLLVTLGWAAFAVLITYRAAIDKLTIDIITSAGANIVLGILLKMLSDVNQFWFRKAPKGERL